MTKKELEKVLDNMEFKRYERERYCERFLPSAESLNRDPEDEDLSDTYNQLI